MISTMETETLAARNVVDLLLKEEFGSGLCMNKTDAPEFGGDDQEVLQAPAPPASQEASKEFVLGWDC
jgi:prenylcysteine oxidase/farnesylcysteine lyase